MMKEKFKQLNFEVSDAELKKLFGYYGHCHNLSEAEFCEEWAHGSVKDSKIIADMKVSLDAYQTALLEKSEEHSRLKRRLAGFFELMLEMVKNYS